MCFHLNGRIDMANPCGRCLTASEGMSKANADRAEARMSAIDQLWVLNMPDPESGQKLASFFVDTCS